MRDRKAQEIIHLKGLNEAAEPFQVNLKSISGSTGDLFYIVITECHWGFGVLLLGGVVFFFGGFLEFVHSIVLLFIILFVIGDG